MAKCILYTRADGGTSTVIPVRAYRADETEAQYLAAIQAGAVPADATNVRIVERRLPVEFRSGQTHPVHAP